MDDAQVGIHWWNTLSEDERRYWLTAAGSAVPADAWRAQQDACGRLVLIVYPTPSGQYAGQLRDDGQDVMRVAGCKNGQEVEAEIQDAGYDDYALVHLDHVP